MAKRQISIRAARQSDISELTRCFECARVYMRECGNPTQWGDSRPSMSLVEADIAHGQCFVCESGSKIVATFAYIEGDDPTYHEIDGQWLGDAPYAVIHRVASDRSTSGVAEAIFNWCRNRAAAKGLDLRIDTHKDNAAMLHVIKKAGFTRCGIIIVDDGTPREAFQLKL